jgi:hypothetical protein
VRLLKACENKHSERSPQEEGGGDLLTPNSPSTLSEFERSESEVPNTKDLNSENTCNLNF